MRIQFTVNSSELATLQNLAKKGGYPDVPSYCKDISLQERSYAKMWKYVTEEIAKMDSGKSFSLKEILDVPPANLGVKLYNNQKQLGIVKVGKSNGCNRFKKL